MPHILVTALILSSTVFAAVSAEAQAVGTFSWQAAPYCNVLTLTVVQNGSVFLLNGFDDQCGGPQRASALGNAFLNPDGTIGMGVTIVVASGGTPLHVDARINLGSLGGPWRDSVGNSGTFVFAPGPSSGAPPRPVPGTGGPAAWGLVNGFSTLGIIQGSPNVVNVVRIAGMPAGGWCIAFSQPIPVERRRAAVVGRVNAGPAAVSPANSTFVDDPACPGGLRIQAVTIASPPTLADALFTFMVP